MSTDLNLGVAPDQEQGSVWDYVSPSRLNLFLRCPLAFRLKYIDGIRSPPTPSLFLGKQVHAALELYHRHRMLGISLAMEDVAKGIVDDWDGVVDEEGIAFADLAEEASLKKQAVDLVTAYLRQVSDDAPPPQAVEVTMHAPLVDPQSGEHLGLPLLGIVDLIEADEAGPVVVDFKTSARAAPPCEITHELQLSSYAYLFRHTTGQRESGLDIRSLIKTKQPKIVCHRYEARSEAHFGRLFAVIREYLDALDSGRFSFRPGWGCGMCEHRDTHCSQWQG